MITPVLAFDSDADPWRPVGVEESLEPHGYEWSAADGGWHRAGGRVDRLDFPARMTQPDLPPVGYHRVMAEENIWWHLFGLWYLYNPKAYGPGIGNHEGDWEFVMIGCTDAHGERPVLIYGSQHGNGAKSVVWAVQRRPPIRTGRPVIFVAQGSHANYLGPVETLEDRADGQGRVIERVEWREFGPWAHWPGRWGNSGNSPGPLSARLIWQHPALAYRRAR